MAEKLYHAAADDDRSPGGTDQADHRGKERRRISSELRSLHVHGVNDAMVTKQRVERLMCAFEDPELFEHGGGHGVPTSADFRARLKARPAMYDIHATRYLRALTLLSHRPPSVKKKTRVVMDDTHRRGGRKAVAAATVTG